MADSTAMADPAASRSPGSAPSANSPVSLTFEAPAEVGPSLATAASLQAHAEVSHVGLAQQQRNDLQRFSTTPAGLTGSLPGTAQTQTSPQKPAEEPEPASITSDIPIAPLPPFSSPGQPQPASTPVAMPAPSFSSADVTDREKRNKERRNALKLALQSRYFPSPLVIRTR